MMRKCINQFAAVLLSLALCLSILPAGIVHAEGSDASAKFQDVMPGQFHYSAIEFVVENGYFNGVSETMFAPDEPMTRAMFVTVLGRFAGVESTVDPTPSFSDVEPGSYYSGYVAWAVKNEIVQGFSPVVFGHASHVTREQAAVFIYRYAKLIGLDMSIEQTASPSTFNSGSAPSPWALTALVWATSRGIMNGVGSELSPQAEVTRAQIAQLLMNFAQYTEE